MEVKEPSAKYLLRPQLRKTEIGLFPHDWRIEPMSSLFNFQNGVNAHKSAYGSGIPFVNVLEVITHSTIAEDQIPGRVTLSKPVIATFEVVRGDVLFNRTSETQEEVGLASVYCGASAVVFGGFVIRAKPTSSDFLPSFAAYALRSPAIRAQIVARGQGVVRANIGQRDLSQIKVFVPPRDEQKVIAETLSDASALIESLEQLIAKKSQIKQGAMQKLLAPKHDWEQTSLDDIANPNKSWSFTGGPFGSNLKAADYTENGVRIIQLQNIGDGKFKDDYEVYTSDQKADELLSCNIFPGEIILSKMGDPVARACIVPNRHERYLMCSDGIRLCVDQTRFDTYFVYTLINAPEFRNKAANAGTGSTRKRIGLTELRNLTLLCPSLMEQRHVAEILSDMDAELAVLDSKLTKARQIKQGMMQELLTGRIRLV